MKYARASLLGSITFIIISMSGELRAQSGSRVYRYSHCNCAGHLPDQIRIGSQDMPIRFDEHSDEQSLKSFRSLKYSVWLGVVRQLYVVGTYNAAISRFRLNGWYAIVPFTEYLIKDENVIPHQVYKIRRSNLKRSDFERTSDFDPDSPEFNPSLYQRKEQRRRGKKAAANKHLQRSENSVLLIR